jgi:hypothetical protein
MELVLACLRCSRGCVREVFKVMAQVDHDLTTVSWVDEQLRLIKNLVRHTNSFSTVLNPDRGRGLLSPASGGAGGATAAACRVAGLHAKVDAERDAGRAAVGGDHHGAARRIRRRRRARRKGRLRRIGLPRHRAAPRRRRGGARRRSR